jgi:hypothetical protein
MIGGQKSPVANRDLVLLRQKNEGSGSGFQFIFSSKLG